MNISSNIPYEDFLFFFAKAKSQNKHAMQTLCSDRVSRYLRLIISDVRTWDFWEITRKKTITGCSVHTVM